MFLPGDDVGSSEDQPMVVVRCFAVARQLVGTGRLELRASTVGSVLEQLDRRVGRGFSEVAATCAVWVNGEPAERSTSLCVGDEVALLPPVSGGA